MQEENAATAVFARDAPDLLTGHFMFLTEGSGISTGVVLERGYRSILGGAELERLGFTRAQRRVPGILIPLWGVDGSQAGYQFRPDKPRADRRGRPVKYESPTGCGNRLDCPPRCRQMLGDPKVPLWVTEGSKKADALASRGACAVSLAGVWGFKGKNRSGGVTFLADWDYIALKGRTVYLAFDSDIVTKEPVRRALRYLAEHLERKGGKIRIIQLPQLEGQAKTGIDDYLIRYSLEDAERLAGELDAEDMEDRERQVSGFILPDGTIGEMVVSDDERCFVISDGRSVRKAYRFETGKMTYLPTSDPLVGEVVHFATTATPYDSQASLFREVRDFIHRYLELPTDFEEIASLYVLLTWVYEFAPSIPYLRVIGDWGSGKTRFLQVVGAICFRPIFASGATTPAPIFRILEQFRGTLVLDEADFKDSAAWVEMVKLLNNGYRPGMPVLRADKENGRWYPRSYQVFGPKLIATRYPFKDEALESRCLTAEMMPLTRDDIPRVLPASFEIEVAGLRAKLLTFRLANLFRLKGKTFGNDLLEPDLQPRLQEILIPLKAMLNGDHSMVETLADFVRRLQQNLFTRRQESNAGRVLAAIIELHWDGEELTSQAIADRANQLDEEAPPLNSEKVGWVVRRLGLPKSRMPGSGRRVVCWDDDKMIRLAALHGLNIENAISQTRLSQLSHPSHAGVGPACDGFCDGLGALEKPSQEIEANRDSCDGCDGFRAEMEEKLGMTLDDALALWAAEGKPIIHLGPGENCFDLEKLLSHRNVPERHLDAVREWLEKRRR